MLRYLNDLRLQRTVPEAVVFYLVYLGVAFVAIMIFGAIFAVMDGQASLGGFVTTGLKQEPTYAIFAAAMFSLAILRVKRQLGNMRYLLVGVASILAATIGGLPLGMAGAAVLTMLPVNSVYSGIIDAQARPIGTWAAR